MSQDEKHISGGSGSDPDLIARAREAARAARASGDEPSQPPVSLAPEHIPGYQIIREIHRGGQGVVYQAIQLTTKRRVAIKVMHEGPYASASDRKRFEREVEILAQLHHPNIVAVIDSGVSDGSFYYIMDYISGRTLDAHVQQANLSRRELLELCAKVCEAINAAHLRGVIHRDIKPSNIRVDPSGEPHIVDFGLAKIAGGSTTDGETPNMMTMTGQFIGSLPWASPEQAEGSPEKIDLRTDVYSLGVVIYQMLTGMFPYEVVGNMRDVLDNILRVEPRRPSSVRRRISDEVETIVLKCLDKQRERRYQSAGEIARDLRRYLAGDPIEAKRDSGLYVLRKLAHKHRTAATVGIVGIIAVVVFAIVTATLWRRAESDRRRADIAAGVAIEAEAVANEQRDRAVLAERLASAERDRAFDAEALAEASRLEAERARDRAIDAEARAVVQEAHAQAERRLAGNTREFLFDAILAAIPKRSGGGEVTMLDFLLETGEQIDETSIGDAVERAEIRTTIGLAMSELGFRAEAVVQLSRAVEVLGLVRALQPSDLRLMRAKRRLAVALRNLGELDRASGLFDELARVIGAHPAEDRAHAIEFLAVRNDRAQLLKLRRSFDEAERELRAVVVEADGLLGEDSVVTLGARRNHAEVLRRLGRIDEAMAILNDAIPIAQAMRDRDHGLIAAMVLERATINVRQQRMDDAERDFRLAIGAYEMLHRQNPAHSDLLNTRFRYALFLYRDAGRAGDAEPILRELVQLADGNADVAPGDRGIYLQGLGWALRLQDKLGQAEGPLVEGFQILRDARGLTNPTVQTVLGRVVELYEELGDADKASEYRLLLDGG